MNIPKRKFSMMSIKLKKRIVGISECLVGILLFINISLMFSINTKAINPDKTNSIEVNFFQQDPDDDKEVINENDSEEIKKLKKKILGYKLKGSSDKLYETYFQIGEHYEKASDFGNAVRYYKKAKKTNKAASDKVEGVKVNRKIADIYYKNKEYNKALDYYNAIMDLCNTGDADYQYASAQAFSINQMFAEKSKIETSVKKDSIAKATSTDVGSLKDGVKNYQNLYESYASKGDFKKSLEYFKLYQQMKDSLTALETAQSMQNLRNEIIQRENAAKIEKLETEASFHAMEKKKNTYILIALILILVLVAGISILIYGQYKLKSKANLILRAQNKEIMEKNEEITAQKDIIQQQHDKVVQQNIEIEEQKKKITDSIKYAQRIQNAFLPNIETFKSAFADAFIFFRPKDIVSGDFYWILKCESKIIWAAVDCTGHGVPGAFMSFVGNMLLKEIVVHNKVEEPDEILFQLREGVVNILNKEGQKEEMQDGMDIALCSYNKQTQLLSYAGANNPLYYFSNNELHEIKADKFAIGLSRKENKAFTKHQIQLNKGDTIYLFSDGYADQFGGPLVTKFSYKNLKKLITDIQNADMAGQYQRISHEFENWKGEQRQMDDVLIVGVKV